MQERNIWHSRTGRVYHNNDHCRSGHSMKLTNIESGRGGKSLCGECADLEARGVPRIMKDWDRTPDGKVHSIVLPMNATWPLSQYLE